MTALNAVSTYPASVWNAVLNSLTYGQGALPAFQAAQGLSLVQALASTFRNARDALDAWILGYYSARAYSIIAQALALPLGLSPATLTLVQARMGALQSFAVAMTTLQPSPVASAANTLAAGNPAVPDPKLLDYLCGFSAEVVPAGLSVANFAVRAQAMATAWAEFAAAAAAALPGTSGFIASEISYMAAASQGVANSIANAPPGTNANVTTAWNVMAALPAIAVFVTGDSSDPTSATAQQLAVMRLVLCGLVAQVYVTVVNMLLAVPNVLQTTTVLAGDTLMKIAAREMGDYTRWQALAALNGLMPPYVAATASPGVAGVGSQIYIPTGSTASTVPGEQQPASQYENSFLGVDIFYGPTTSDMLEWTGDLQTIIGYQNLAFSLGRRLQTPLESLIYHGDFGSRIPGEIGNIQIGTGGSQPLVGSIEAYGQSSLLGDQRVARILSVVARVLSNQFVSVAFTVLPQGRNVPISSQQQPPRLGLGSGVPVGGVTGSGVG